MNLLTSTPERGVIATVQYLPAVSIIMPFTPVITLKKNLEYNLKNVMGKVEAMLAAHYTAEKAIPILVKLKNLFCNLNYSTHQKSIAIFVSPVVEKVYYFGVEMEEKIVIDPSFKIRDLVGCKKEKKEYLILYLCNKFSKMYLSNGTQLRLIKSNTVVNCLDPDNEREKDPTSADREEFITANFLHQMDQGLSIILKSYPLPVLVIGPEKLLNHFKKLTKNDENVVQFIHGNCEEASQYELHALVDPVVFRWRKLKQQHLLKRVENARVQNKLRTGVKEVLEATMQNKGRLLVVEKQLMNSPEAIKTGELFIKTDSIGSEAFFIKDAVDNIIKKIFENGGDVEFIADGLLKNYNSIALIEKCE